jgi:parallel beta-helix repeat protein
MKIMKAIICLTLLLISLSIISFAVNGQAQTPFSGAIIIGSDGSINPSSAPIQKSGETYTFLESFTGNITVQRDNIVLDGAGFRINTTGIGVETTIGIDLSFRSNITVTNMQVSDFVQGIHLLNSTNCTLIGNNITANVDGIRIDNSTNNSIIGNNITTNRHGTHPYEGNVFYHNNFINSTDRNVFFDSAGHVDTWDNGYPSGGNYWSNYTGVDEKKGSSQSDAGSDGIGDTPQILSPNNTDRYPLMVPYVYAPQPTSQQNPLWIYVTIGVAAIAAVIVALLFLRKTRALKKE